MASGGGAVSGQTGPGIGWLRLSFSVLHILMACAGFFRPNMIVLVKGYSNLGQVGSTVGWSWVMLAIGIGLMFLPRSSVVLIAWQGLSACLFALFGLLVTSGSTGLTWGSVVYAWLCLVSGVMAYLTAYLTADQLFRNNGVPRRLRRRIGRHHGG